NRGLSRAREQERCEPPPTQQFQQCERGDSNPHAVKHKNLNLACLPVPPRSQRGHIYHPRATYGTSLYKDSSADRASRPCSGSRSLRGEPRELADPRAEAAQWVHRVDLEYFCMPRGELGL